MCLGWLRRVQMEQNQISFLFAFIRVNSRLKKLFASHVDRVISRTTLHDGLLDFPGHLDKFQAVAKTLAASNECLHSDFIAGIREGEFQADEGAHGDARRNISAHTALADGIAAAIDRDFGSILLSGCHLQSDIDLVAVPSPYIRGTVGLNHLHLGLRGKYKNSPY